MGFNLEEYEIVKLRKKRFFEKFTEGRLIVTNLKSSPDDALFVCLAFKNTEEQKLQMPMATGYSYAQKGLGSPANKWAWHENAEESAVGRCLDNLGLSGNNKCSREEMDKVIQMESQPKTAVTATKTEPTVYTAKIGKHAGLSLDKIPELANYIDGLKGRALTEGKEIVGLWRELIDEADKYLISFDKF